MKCPQFIMASLHLRNDITNPDTDCIKEVCAWWSASEQQCAAMIVAANLAGLVAIGDRLLDKMPHEE